VYFVVITLFVFLRYAKEILSPKLISILGNFSATGSSSEDSI